MTRMKAEFLLIGALIANSAAAQESVDQLEAKIRQTPDDVATLVQLGRVYHDKGAAGDESAVEKGFAFLDKALSIEPSNAVALAYRGSLWTMRGRDAWWPFTKMSDVDKGTDEMDKAVDLAPDDVTVRLVRGINSVQLPSMFHRLPVALRDFERLLKNAAFARYPAPLQCTIYCWAGIANKHDGQTARAKELLRKAAEIGAGSPAAGRAADELKDIP